MLLRLPDPERRYAAVRLCSDLALPEELRVLSRRDGEWRLELDLPRLTRLEYEFEVVESDGASERIRDPGNPRGVEGAFGGRSVLLAPGYEPPRWLGARGIAGAGRTIGVHGRGLGADVEITLWSPADAEDSEALPLLVAHDGPEYAQRSRLTDFAAVQIRAGALPRHRIALLGPGERDEWYSASARYAGALARDVLPAIGRTVATRGAPVGMGASLGGLAMLHAQWRHAPFGAVLSQSGSFFTPRFDARESAFGRYQRVVRFVRQLRREPDAVGAVPVVLTCGVHEENIHNNRLVARTLGAPLHELGDTHNHTAWRDALDPHLTHLLQRVW